MQKVGSNGSDGPDMFQITWICIGLSIDVTPSKKLSKNNLGLFEVIRSRSHLYTLQLPNTMKAVHPVFHVSHLEPFMPNTIPNQIQSPPPVIIDSKPKFEISKILDSNINKHCRACKLLYLVWWEGIDNEISWILAPELKHPSDLIADFHSS